MPPSRHSPKRAANIEQQAPVVISKLRTLIGRHPYFARQLEQCIETITHEAERSPESDRGLVWCALEQGCNCVEDIAEETGLQEWEVRQILAGWVEAGVVEEIIEQRHGMGRSAARLLYFQKHHLTRPP